MREVFCGKGSAIWCVKTHFAGPQNPLSDKMRDKRVQKIARISDKQVLDIRLKRDVKRLPPPRNCKQNIHITSNCK